MQAESRTFGEFLHDERAKAGKSMRDLAHDINVSPSYICDIEADRRIPSETVIEALSESLDLSFFDVMARSGRLTTRAERYLKRRPDLLKYIEQCAAQESE